MNTVVTFVSCEVQPQVAIEIQFEVHVYVSHLVALGSCINSNNRTRCGMLATVFPRLAGSFAMVISWGAASGCSRAVFQMIGSFSVLCERKYK